MERCAGGANHVVPAVGGWVVDGFVFAHEEESDARGEAAEGEGCGVVERYVMPGAGVGQSCLKGRKC